MLRQGKLHFALVFLLLVGGADAFWPKSSAANTCEKHLLDMANEKAAVYFAKYDPRFYHVRRKIVQAVKKRFPDLAQVDPEQVTRYVYDALRDYEEKRSKIPPKGYLFWAANFSAPLVTLALTYKYVPTDYHTLVAVVGTYVTTKLLDPLGSAVQEKWNARLKNTATNRPSAFASNMSAVNRQLRALNDRAVGALTSWEDAGDGKLRNIEVALLRALDKANAFYDKGEKDLAVRFAADAAVDYLVRWPYLRYDEPLLLDKIQHELWSFPLRHRLADEILARPLIRAHPDITRLSIDLLLSHWMPHNPHRSLAQAFEAHQAKDFDRAVRYAADAVTACALQSNRCPSAHTARRFLAFADASFRTEVEQAALARSAIQESEAASAALGPLLDVWIPEDRQTP